MHTLRPPGGKGLLHIGGVDVVKGAIGVIVGAVVRWRVLIGERATEPVALDLGHVPHEPEQRQRRGWDRPPAELLGRQAAALPLQGDTVIVEPCLEHYPLWGRPWWCRSRDFHCGPPRTRHDGRVPWKGLITQHC